MTAILQHNMDGQIFFRVQYVTVVGAYVSVYSSKAAFASSAFKNTNNSICIRLTLSTVSPYVQKLIP